MTEQNKPDLTMTITEGLGASLASDGCTINPGDQFRCYKVPNAEAPTKPDGYVLVHAETIPKMFADYLNGTLPDGYSAGDMADQGAKQFRAGRAEGQKDMREMAAQRMSDLGDKASARYIRALPIPEGEQ